MTPFSPFSLPFFLGVESALDIFVKEVTRTLPTGAGGGSISGAGETGHIVGSGGTLLTEKDTQKRGKPIRSPHLDSELRNFAGN